MEHLAYWHDIAPAPPRIMRTVYLFSLVQARDRPSGLRAFAEVLLEPSGRDVWLGTAGTLEAAKITSLSDE